MKPRKMGIPRIIDAFGYSMQGLQFTYQNEAAFRQEILASLMLLPLAVWLADSAQQFAILLTPIALVLVVELLNSAIEAIVDRIGSEIHVLSGAAKDIGSAAVLVSIIFFVLVWGSFLIQKIF